MYICMGAGGIVIYRDSQLQFLLSLYFFIYAVMGFMWHARELHMATLWLATPDQVCTIPYNCDRQLQTSLYQPSNDIWHSSVHPRHACCGPCIQLQLLSRVT